MKKIFENKGITLIALVITIIVLLILAGVTISTIVGNESAMEKAKQAKEANESANELDTIKLAVTDAIVKETDGLVHLDKLNESLSGLIKSNATGEAPWKVIGSMTEKTYRITKYGQVEETEEVGDKVESINSKIGKQVNYTSPQDSEYTGTWRVFYADDDYVFIISTTNVLNGYSLDGNDKAENSKYNVVSSLSEYGVKYNDLWQKELSKAGKTADTNSSGNLSGRARATAYLCDSENWNKYVSSSLPTGTFAVGGPTIELLVKSWNAAKESNISGAPSTSATWNDGDVISGGYLPGKPTEFSSNNSPYSIDEEILPLEVDNESYGLYNAGENYWLASPGSNNMNGLCYIHWYGYVSINGYSTAGTGIRLLICIPTSSFNVNMIID